MFEASQIICFIKYIYIYILKLQTTNLPKLREVKLVNIPISLGRLPVKELLSAENNSQNNNTRKEYNKQ